MTEMTMTDLIELQDLGLCLLAVVTHDHVARALVLGVLGLDLQQHVGGDRLDLRYHQMGPLGFDHAAQRRAVGHGEHMAAVGHLHGRRVGITVYGDHFAAQPLQGDRHLLAQFAAAEQHDAERGGGQGGAKTHGGSPGSCKAAAAVSGRISAPVAFRRGIPGCF